MKNHATNLITTAAAAAMLLAAPFASATVIFSEDFNSLTPGAAPGAPFGGGTTGGGHANVVAADSNFATQYYELTSRADNGNFNFAFFDSNLTTPLTSDVATFSFDARFNTADFGNFARMRLRARQGAATDGSFDVSRADVGAGGGAPILNSIIHLDYAVNNTGSSVPIEGVGGTLGADSWAIYQDGALLTSGSNQGSAPTGAVTYLTTWVQGDFAGTGTVGVARIDNFEIRDNAYAMPAVVPEPTSMALLGIGAVLAGLYRRMR